MTREELINSKEYKVVNAAFDWMEEHKDADLLDAFEAGAEWADKHPKNPQLSAADKGIIDEIIFALNSLGKEKMISYYKEIEFLNKIRNL